MMRRETIVNIIILALLAAVPLAANLFDNPYLITLATRAAVLALAGVGLNLALGYGGLVSFGHAAFFGLGGYAAGIVFSHAFSGQPIPLFGLALAGSQQTWVLWLVAIGVSGLGALVIGALSLRTSGVYFIMITLAFAQMIYYFAISWPAYGGEDGLSTYIRSQFFGINMMVPLNYYLLAAGVLVAAVALSAMLVRSRFGLALQGARQNEARSVSLGIAPYRIRLTAFVISGMITGLAGAMFADLYKFVSPTMMSWSMSGEIMIFVILGGVGRLFGPLAGAMLFVTLEHLLGGVTEYWQFLLGLLLLLVVLFARGGVIGILAGGQRHG